MILCFALSMPSNNAWNGKWSGSESYYVKIINFGRTKKATEKAKVILDKGYYSHVFGDGWVAGITISAIDAKEAAKRRRKSSGFCGYDWMVDSIIANGCIKTSRGGIH